MFTRIMVSALILSTLFFCELPSNAAARTATTARQSSDLNPTAMSILKQMSDYLVSLNRFTVHVDSMMDVITRSNMTLIADKEMDVYVQRPNKLRVDSFVPDRNRQIFYDQCTITMYSPDKKLYTVIPAPPTIPQTIAAARAKGVEMPLADLLDADPYKAISARARHAYYIGMSRVGGVNCRQLAFRGTDMDWQIWVQSGQTPLVRRVVIIDRGVKGSPRFVATLSNWNLSPSFTDSTFQFVPPADAHKIPFASVRPSIPRRSK